MIATIQFFGDVNYMAVLVATLAYFALGALWYSVLFQKTWSKGIEEMGIKMSMPGKGAMGVMMLKSFLWNLLCVLSMAFLIHAVYAYTALSALKLGIVGGAGLSLASLGMTANWTGTKTSVLIIDAGYQICGIAIASMIIGSWH